MFYHVLSTTCRVFCFPSQTSCSCVVSYAIYLQCLCSNCLSFALFLSPPFLEVSSLLSYFRSHTMLFDLFPQHKPFKLVLSHQNNSIQIPVLLVLVPILLQVLLLVDDSKNLQEYSLNPESIPSLN